MRTWKSKKEFKELFIEKAEVLFEKSTKDLSRKEVYQILATMIKDLVSEDWLQTEKKYNRKKVRQVYYFSIEFLLGRLLDTNLLNCNAEKICRNALQDFGFELDEIFSEEPDPGLGNGGLGRLAACFIDSMAAMQLPGHGCSIRYQYGLFDQRIVDGQQVELPDAWLRNGFPWEIKKADKAVDVRFGGEAYVRPGKDGKLVCVHEHYNTVRAVPYDVPVLGYQNRTVNTLRLWKAEYTRENMYNQLRYAVRFIVEPFWKPCIKRFQCVGLQNFRMQLCHAVYTVASHNSQAGHMDLVIPKDRHFLSLVFSAGKTLSYLFQPPSVNFIYNQEDTRQKFLEHGNGPTFQRLRHNRMIGIRYSICCDAPCIIPAHSFFVH